MTNNTAAAAQTTIVFETGDIVWGRPVVEGKTLARRKGIVLGTLNDDDADRLVIWWFGQGAATADNTTMMFRRELTKAGDIFGAFGAVRAEKLAKLADAGYGRARFVRNMLVRHAGRMRAAGVL